MATPDLKPCPFCGGKAVIQTNNRGLWIVGCVDDFMCMGNINHIAMIHITEEQAVEAWNRRAYKEERNPEDCRYYAKSTFWGGRCIGTKGFDLCEGSTCKHWKSKEGER